MMMLSMQAAAYVARSGCLANECVGWVRSRVWKGGCCVGWLRIERARYMVGGKKRRLAMKVGWIGGIGLKERVTMGRKVNGGR